MQNPLSSNLALAVLFRFRSRAQAQYDALLTPISMTKSSPPPVERAFTLIELLVVIATHRHHWPRSSFQLFKSALERAKATKDMSNLRQIGALMQMLSQRQGWQFFPTTATWPGTSASPSFIQNTFGTRRVFQSPFDKRPLPKPDDAHRSATASTQICIQRLADKLRNTANV